MKFTSIILFILLSKFSLCQNNIKLYFENDTINQVDRFGNKLGFWQHYYFNSDFDRVITSEGYYRNNKQIGNWNNYRVNNGIFSKDTLIKNGAVRIVYNKGEYLTEINFDSTQILHFSMNDIGKLTLHDKCIKKNANYNCRRYSKLGILLNEIYDITFHDAFRILFW